MTHNPSKIENDKTKVRLKIDVFTTRILCNYSWIQSGWSKVINIAHTIPEWNYYPIWQNLEQIRTPKSKCSCTYAAVFDKSLIIFSHFQKGTQLVYISFRAKLSSSHPGESLWKLTWNEWHWMNGRYHIRNWPSTLSLMKLST